MTTALSASALLVFGDFLRAAHNLFPPESCEKVFTARRPRGAGVPKLTLYQWVMALVYHALAGSGTFAAHVRALTGMKISDSALSQRKQSVGWELFAELLPEVLRPLADAARHPSAFYEGLRLCALDGIRFNLRNTAALNAAGRKVRCSKGGAEPAFAQLLCVVLAELGTHQPLAAAPGWQGEGEITLARRLLGHLPERCLLVADRLYCSPWLLWELGPALQEKNSHSLLRVKANIHVRCRRPLADGSRLIAAPVKDPATGRMEGHVLLREITAQITVAGSKKPLEIRLWTTLLDPRSHPAQELVKLYAGRWEEELFFRELKSHVQGTRGLLHSQRPESAAQDVLALLLAAALLASQRAAVAEAAGVPVLRISLAQVQRATILLSETLEAGEGLLTKTQQAQLTLRMLERLQQTALIRPRAPRRCQRALRQPIRDWPKMRHPTSLPLVRTIKIQRPNP
jgi:hypothetical protein